MNHNFLRDENGKLVGLFLSPTDGTEQLILENIEQDTNEKKINDFVIGTLQGSDAKIIGYFMNFMYEYFDFSNLTISK